MLYNSDFLRELDQCKEKTLYAKIVSLTMDEDPIEQVEGRITTGSVNIDGTSAVRRTCSLTMISQDVNINDYYWGLNTKFRLEIGVENKVDKRYPDIIWFKMGTYIITSFNTSLSTNSYTISLQGKDKMCLLNGEVGGVINATTDFGTYDYTDTATGMTTNYKYPIKKIIWDAVHAYANEPFHNIVINDVDDLGLELLDYKYDTPMYLFRNPSSDEYSGEVQIGSQDAKPNYTSQSGSETISLEDSNFIFDNLTSSMIGYDQEPTHIWRTSPGGGRVEYVVAKIEYGHTAGYRTCDLVYAGDLIANIGESVTSVLDKIKNMLGEFEYFYNLDGQFVFQRKKSLVNTVWTPQRRDGDNELYIESLALASNSMYNFNGTVLLSSFNNNPNLLNLRNDYTVWGKKKGITGQEYPIHMRYAIDNKPEIYADFNGEAWTVFSHGEITTQNEGRKVIDRRAAIYEAWENFERDLKYYPESMWKLKEGTSDPEYYIDPEEQFWSMSDWARYYEILFREPPGNNHPQDEMKNYCSNYIGNKAVEAIYNVYGGYILRGINRSQDTITADEGYPTGQSCTVVLFCKDENNKDIVYYNAHWGCVHTYKEWLDIEYYVNGGYPITNDKGEKIDETLPFDSRYFNNYWSRNIHTNNITYVDSICTKDNLDYLRMNHGLYRAYVYCYNPKIPDDLREKQMQEIENEIDFIDEYDDGTEEGNHYHYDMDWRELIYRMAIDYRRHNHDDNFETTLARNNRQWFLYQTGITGYEQYYTDMEGFWRELYNPQITEAEKEQVKRLDYKSYAQIEDKTDLSHIYIQGVYKPVGQKVKAVAEEAKVSSKQYRQDLSTKKWYLYEPDTEYWISETNGFSFTGHSPGSQVQDFVQLAAEGKLYTRTYPSIQNLYVYKNGSGFNQEMYSYMDTLKYANDTQKHYLKNVNTLDPQNPTFSEILETPLLSSSQKVGSYVLTEDGATGYNVVNDKMDQATANLDELDNLNILALSKHKAGLICPKILVSNFTPWTDELVREAPTVLGLRPTTYLLSEFVTDFNDFVDQYNSAPTTEHKNRIITDQYKLLQGVLAAANKAYQKIQIEVNKTSGTLDYELYSAQLTRSKLTLANLENNTFFVYDDSTMYKMSDVVKNTKLRALYTTGGAIKDELIKFTLDNDGNKTVNSIKKSLYYYIESSDYYDENAEERQRFWRKEVFEAPHSLIFWFDFLTGDGELRQFTTQAIGDRPKAINDTNVKSIYYRDTPKVIFTTPEKLASEEKKPGYNYLSMDPQYEGMFSISTQGIDAKNRIDELLYQYSYCTEQISITAIPIYYLDVNKRISVFDKETNIGGEYVVSRIAFSLAYNGTMQITATKAPENSVTEREE